MPNYRFTILMKHYFSRYDIVDIISRLIYQSCVPDNEEAQGFCKLSNYLCYEA